MLRGCGLSAMTAYRNRAGAKLGTVIKLERLQLATSAVGEEARIPAPLPGRDEALLRVVR